MRGRVLCCRNDRRGGCEFPDAQRREIKSPPGFDEAFHVVSETCESTSYRLPGTHHDTNVKWFQTAGLTEDR